MKKYAVITTTINFPHVLSLYRKYDDDTEHTRFFVIGDKNMKVNEYSIRSFLDDIGNAEYYSAKDQEELGYECSELIGWKKIMRRNIGILEALKWGAEVIVSVDDDNIPLSSTYFYDLFPLNYLGNYQGISVTSQSSFFNPCTFYDSKLYHRGYPFSQRDFPESYKIIPSRNCNVAVCAGMWMGEPDIDAVNRLVLRPFINDIPNIYEDGFVVSPGTYSPFNSQNTAYIRDVAPLMFLYPHIGRYDDIWASYVAEKVMHSENMVVHYGKPYTYQERNQQNTIKNLKDEIYGMENTTELFRQLYDVGFPTMYNMSILQKLEWLYDKLYQETPDLFPKDLTDAWIRDCKRVL